MPILSSGKANSHLIPTRGKCILCLEAITDYVHKERGQCIESSSIFIVNHAVIGEYHFRYHIGTDSAIAKHYRNIPGLIELFRSPPRVKGVIELVT
jgi:hypothetical protein